MSNMNFTCDVCGREISGCNIVNGMTFCAKCYQETFGGTKYCQHIEHKSQENTQNDELQLLFLITDRYNKIILDSQRRPTIYRSEKQLKKYRYKFKDTDKICIYKLETEMSFDDYFKTEAKEMLENE